MHRGTSVDDSEKADELESGQSEKDNAGKDTSVSPPPARDGVPISR